MNSLLNSALSLDKKVIAQKIMIN